MSTGVTVTGAARNDSSARSKGLSGVRPAAPLREVRSRCYGWAANEGGGSMYGTVGRAHVRPENRDRLAEVVMNPAYAEVPGYRRGYLMFPENRENEVLIVAVFEDRDAYVRNADDPAQHRRYLEYRALLEDEPEWSDGEWMEAPTGSG